MINPGKRLTIIKNTLPYIHPYSIFDTETNEVIGQYKTIKIAEKIIETIIKKFISSCGQRKIKEIAESLNCTIKKYSSNDPIKCYEERINKPDGDKLPKSEEKSKRIVRINDVNN